MYSKSSKFLAPPDLEKSIETIFFEMVKKSHYGIYLEDSIKVIELAEKSEQDLIFIADIQRIFTKITSNNFNDFIRLLNISLFIRTLKINPVKEAHSKHISTPITNAVNRLLEKTDMESALKLLSLHLVDVLTSHPVDMDRGIVINLKGRIVELTQCWELEKKAYTAIQDEDIKIIARASLVDLNRKIRDAICQLIHTPNYRSVKIKPESEQRNLSRSIKANEEKIIAHWPKLILFIQFVFFEQIMKEAIKKTPKISTSLNTLFNLPRTPESMQQICDVKVVRMHTCFHQIISLQTTITYTLHIWRGDMDGNPLVNGMSIAQSIAYGRMRCFERLSADEAVIRYNPLTPEFNEIEQDLKNRLSHFKKVGSTAWKSYIIGREKAGWTPIQIYSGWVYFRMVEMTEAAEKFSRNKRDLNLLTVGFKNEKEFLDIIDPLRKAEKSAGIQMGAWHQLNSLVKLRGLSLGVPHARNGESVHIKLVSEVLSIIFPNVLKTPDAFMNCNNNKKKHFLNDLIKQDIPNSLIKSQGFSNQSKKLLTSYLSLTQIQPNGVLVQSDSGSITKDIELSILLLKTLGHIVGHHGQYALLCEDKNSMCLAIKLMEKGRSTLFDRMIMMCAGSDNQKKTGPFYSAYINNIFLKTAHKNRILAFFGVGDSPLRSSTMDPQCAFKTFQPGSRKKHFLGGNVFSYLSHRLASQIDHISSNLNCDPNEEINYENITRTLGECMFEAYSKSITQKVKLQSEVQFISEIVTTYFSRPSKKYGGSEVPLNTIRARKKIT